MGFGIPNTTWNTNTLVSEIALPTTVSQYEVLPNGSFNYPCTPGVTYTQSVYISVARRAFPASYRHVISA